MRCWAKEPAENPGSHVSISVTLGESYQINVSVTEGQVPSLPRMAAAGWRAQNETPERAATTPLWNTSQKTTREHVLG